MHQTRNRTSVWSMLAFLIVILAAAIVIGDVRETDVYWHILMGQDILVNGRLTGNPTWVYGPGDPGWVTTQWASEILFYLVFEISGWTGIVALRVLLAVGVFVSIFTVVKVALPPTCTREQVARAQVFIGTLALIGSVSMIQERPQTISFIILPWIGLWLLRLLYTGQWPKWWIIGLVVAIWSWFHGASLLVAPLLLVVYLVRQIVVRPKRGLSDFLLHGLPTLLAVVVAPVLSPIGWNYYKQALLIREAASGIIVEWGPASLASPIVIAWLGLLGIWVYAVVAFVRTSRGASLKPLYLEAAWLIVLLGFSILAARYVPLSFLLAVPLVARRLSLALQTTPARNNIPYLWANAFRVFAVAVLLATFLSALGNILPSPEGTSPNRIWSGLGSATGERRVLVDYNLSGKTLALTSPSIRVSIDGRSDRYVGYIEDYRSLTNGEPEWRSVFTRHYGSSTDALLQDTSPLVESLRRDGWALVCSNNGYVWLTAPGYSGRCPT